MNINKLKSKVESYRGDLKNKSGVTCLFSENGPANMDLIDAIVKVLEYQESRIEMLEYKINS